MAKITSTTVAGVPIRALEFKGRDLFGSVPHHPVQIIVPSLVLIVGSDDGEILAAGTMAHMRRVLRRDMSAAEAKQYIHSWPRFMSLDFQQGTEPCQTTADGDHLTINATGLLKLAVIFNGKVGKFLEKHSNAYNSALRFIERVATLMSNGIPTADVPGATARYTSGILEPDKSLQYVLGRIPLREALMGKDDKS